MKETLLLFVLIFTFAACNQAERNRVSSPDFCQLFAEDQKGLGFEQASATETMAEKTDRRRLSFQKNWRLMFQLIGNDQLGQFKTDSCFNSFISSTLTHTAQQFPSDMFQKDAIDALAREQLAGHIRSGYLKITVRFFKDFTTDDKRCIHLKPMVDYAINKWRVNEDLENTIHEKIENIEYIDCSSED